MDGFKQKETHENKSVRYMEFLVMITINKLDSKLMIIKLLTNLKHDDWRNIIKKIVSHHILLQFVAVTKQFTITHATPFIIYTANAHGILRHSRFQSLINLTMPRASEIVPLQEHSKSYLFL